MRNNIVLFDYHTQVLEHGCNKPLRVEETIEAAIRFGLSAICLTDHYPLPPSFVDPTEEKDCAMSLALYPEYQRKVRLAQEKYKDKIEVAVGSEFDWLPEYIGWTRKQINLWLFDYIVGSVHFLGQIEDKRARRNFLLDYKEEEFKRGIAYYGGIKPLVKAYYGEIQNMTKSKMFDSVGHFDLVKKYNDGSLFSEKEKWYREKVLETLRIIADSEMAIEINTASWDKICQAPYPSEWIVKQAYEKNIPLTIGSDAHTPKAVGKDLDRAVILARQAGYRKLVGFNNRQKIKIPI